MTAENQKKRIVWVTPDYFVDCDFNPGIFSNLLTTFDIHWIVLLPGSNARFSEDDFANVRNLDGLHLEFRYWKCRARSPKMLLFYEALYARIKSLAPDVIYFNDVPTSPYILPMYWRFNKHKTIVTAHDGNVKPSFKLAWISKIVFELAFRTVKYVNMFSKSQARIFQENFDPAKIFLIPLGLKDFGATEVQKRSDVIVFFFFGSINPSKNVELLIDAACDLHEQGVTGFKVCIYGSCPNWAPYQSRMKYPSIFECDIRLIPSFEVPKIFGENHYMVFPYSQMSQSGALKAAFNYCVPVIVSNLEGFTDEVVDGENGFVFQSGNVSDLARTMLERLVNHRKAYEAIIERMAVYNNENYSATQLSRKYREMFDEVIHTNAKA